MISTSISDPAHELRASLTAPPLPTTPRRDLLPRARVLGGVIWLALTLSLGLGLDTSPGVASRVSSVLGWAYFSAWSLSLPAACAQLAAALGGRLVRPRRPQHGRFHVLRALQLLPAVGPGDARRVRQGERRPRQRGQGERRRPRAARGGAHRGSSARFTSTTRRAALLARRQGGARRLRAAHPVGVGLAAAGARLRLVQPGASSARSRAAYHAHAALDVSVRQARDHADEVRAAGGAPRGGARPRVEHRQRRPRLHRRHASSRNYCSTPASTTGPRCERAAAMPHTPRATHRSTSLTTATHTRVGERRPGQVRPGFTSMVFDTIFMIQHFASTATAAAPRRRRRSPTPTPTTATAAMRRARRCRLQRRGRRRRRRRRQPMRRSSTAARARAAGSGEEEPRVGRHSQHGADPIHPGYGWEI